MIISDDIKQLCLDEYLHYTNDIDIHQGNSRLAFSEIFDMVKDIPDEFWEDGITFFDPFCEIGDFLLTILVIKKYLGHENLINTVFGMDPDMDNVITCRQRIIKFIGEHSTLNELTVDNNISSYGDDDVIDRLYYLCS